MRASPHQLSKALGAILFDRCGAVRVEHVMIGLLGKVIGAVQEPFDAEIHRLPHGIDKVRALVTLTGRGIWRLGLSRTETGGVAEIYPPLFVDAAQIESLESE